MKTGVMPMIGLFFLICCTADRNSSLSEETENRGRYLIITADDFGAAANINEGIAKAAEMNSLTSISVFANFPESLPQLQQICAKHPEIGIGIHLNITTGKPVADKISIPSLVNKGNFYTLEEILPRLQNISITELHHELKSQVLLLKNFGINITFISDHNGILTYYTPFYNVIIDLAKEFNLAVRTPTLASFKYPQQFHDSKMTSFAKKTAMKAALHKPVQMAGLLKYIGYNELERKADILDSLGIAHPDVIIDNFWGQTSPAYLMYLLQNLPGGVSELIVHLGTETRQYSYPSGLDSSYFIRREEEMESIINAEQKSVYKQLKISKIKYSDLCVIK